MKNRIPEFFSSKQPEDIEAMAQAWSDASKEQLEQWRRKLEDYVGGNPAAALGAALCLGVLLGWLIKRRS